MSGGSFNYLGRCYDSDDLIREHRSDLQEMAEFLGSLGYAEDAARESEELLCILNAALIRIDVRIKRLQPIWRAAEWWQSLDTSEDDLKKALAKYRGEGEECPANSSATAAGSG